jgi:hypothetical protein
MADAEPDDHIPAQCIEIAAQRTKKGEMSQMEFVNLAIASPEITPKTLYVNLGKVAGQLDDTSDALITNATDSQIPRKEVK